MKNINPVKKKIVSKINILEELENIKLNLEKELEKQLIQQHKTTNMFNYSEISAKRLDMCLSVLHPTEAVYESRINDENNIIANNIIRDELIYIQKLQNENK